MDIRALIQILLHGNQLKRTIRSGWAQRGVAQPENVAAHSYGTAYTALVLAETIADSFDLAAVLAMAILHDLPEGLTTDIPAPAWRFMPPGTKSIAEQRAMESIMAGDSPAENRFMVWWAELKQNATPEARLVHDADKLDQYLQAYIYERQTGNQQLTEFWEHPHQFFFPEAQKVYNELVSRRENPGQASL